jgi:hypothetical protein
VEFVVRPRAGDENVLDCIGRGPPLDGDLRIPMIPGLFHHP